MNEQNEWENDQYVGFLSPFFHLFDSFYCVWILSGAPPEPGSAALHPRG